MSMLRRASGKSVSRHVIKIDGPLVLDLEIIQTEVTFEVMTIEKVFRTESLDCKNESPKRELAEMSSFVTEKE